MADEPVTFVVERNLGWREVAGVYYGKLPDRLTRKGSALMVFAWRLDKLPNGAALQRMPIGDLYDQFCRMREAGNLPASNLADPPRQTEGRQKGSERGPETWWKPTPLPRGQDWTPDSASLVIGFDEPEPAVLLFPAAE